MRDINGLSVGGMPWPQTGATQYHAQLGLPDKCHAMKELVVCKDLDLESLALGCYQRLYKGCR